MIIGACGYGATGSGAIFDFLREFDDIQVKSEAEFKYTYQVDGLQDLEYHLMKQYAKNASGDMAIKRFLSSVNYAHTPFVGQAVPRKEYIRLSKEYASSIYQATWIGMESADYEVGFLPKSVTVLGFKKFIIPWYEKIFKKTYNFWPLRRLYVAIEPDGFYEKSAQYMEKMLLAMGFDLSKPILLNQPFEGNNPENSFKYFKNPKAIVVDRDPRDVFLAHEKVYFGEGRHMPRGDVKAFVELYRNVRKNQKRIENDKIIFINFEDLVYNYEKTTQKVINFLGIKNHSNPKKFFDPEKSIFNTQLYNKYLGYDDEIKYIENELKEYLFPYHKYPKLKKFKKTF